MGRNLDPKCKQCRREREKLFLKGDRCFSAKCAMVKRNYPPGLHGVTGRVHLTEYGKQLREKQKTKRIYQLLEKQFRNYFKNAVAKKGNTEEVLLQLLELRLDNVIYRLGWASSRVQARQLVSHNFFEVNNKKVNIPSFQLKVGDVISFKESKEGSKVFENVDNKKDLPSCLSFDANDKLARITSLPKIEDLQQTIDMKLIVEYYSR